MCGIVALVGRDAAACEPIHSMTAMLTHRGPDDDGFAILPEDGVALGMRRLSILDIEGGAQPMWDERRRHVVVFNGEIYNFAGLRAELASLGHRFISDHSDTEVIVHGFEEWGDALFPRLNGMFAIALWDRLEKRLTLARDRTGEKPLFVAELPTGWAVASELKAIFDHPEFIRRVDPVGLEQYLAFDFTVGPRTMLAGVQKLPAGHIGRIERGAYAFDPYWSLGFRSRSMSIAAAVARLDELLDRSVRMRMLADVPVGLFLSGGLDSSAIGYYMSRAREGTKSFSIGFEDPRFDESTYARLAARHLGVDHHLEVFSEDRVRALVPRVAELLDEPMGDQSIFPTYLLSTVARRGVTVALGGDGSDELLMGYKTYQALKLVWQFDRLPRSARSVLARCARRRPIPGVPPRVWRLLSGLDDAPSHRLLRRLGSFDGDARSVLSGPVRDQLPVSAFSDADDSFGLDRLLLEGPAEETIAAYVRGYLQEDILVKVDRASMAASLEVRAPFLDPDLIDFLATVPASLKLRRWTRKHLLREAMRGRLPDQIIDRPKRGFGVPLNDWLRGSLAPLVRERLAPDGMREGGYFDPAAVSSLVEVHLAGRRDEGQRIWLLLQFELWRDRWQIPRFDT
jgi:asparagine synthase (glutamine-hydrolysing)